MDRNIKAEEESRNEFREVLLYLSSSQNRIEDDLESIYQRLESLYIPDPSKPHFRHFYSDIFSVLTEIMNEDSNSTNTIETLGYNIQILRSSYVPKEEDLSIEDELRKLYDHVSLDIARILYTNSAEDKVRGESSVEEIRTRINDVEEKITGVESTQKEVRKLQANVKSVKEDLSNSQKEYIAILGIFAAIVLAFTGGITFSTSVLNNINSVSPYRLVFVALIIGLVLINILFALFYYLDRLVKGKQENEEKNIRPLWVTNTILLFLLLATVVAWHFGVVEHRNETVPNEMASTIYMEINNREQAMPFPDYFINYSSSKNKS